MIDDQRGRPSPPHAGRLEPHPEPPIDLTRRTLPWFDIGTTPQPWCRIHRASRGPIHFGRSPDGRFNAPAREFGVLYLATDPFGAFVETLGQVIGNGVVALSDVAARSLCWATTIRPLALVDLTGAGLVRIGADARLCTGGHALAQR